MRKEQQPVEGSVDYFMSLGFTTEESKSLASRWKKRPKLSPQEELDRAQRGSNRNIYCEVC